MKAKELRIGNIVSIFGIEQHIITELKNTIYVDLNPIPITEEWLLKFGFTIYFKKWKNDKKEIYLISEANGIGLCYNKIDNDWEVWLLNCDYELRFMLRWIKHVNQLQNLYFALTGEELKLLKDE